MTQRWMKDIQYWDFSCHYGMRYSTQGILPASKLMGELSRKWNKHRGKLN